MEQLIPVASEKSVGSTVSFNGNQVEVVSMEMALDMNAHVALFSAGGSTSWAQSLKRGRL